MSRGKSFSQRSRYFVSNSAITCFSFNIASQDEGLVIVCFEDCGLDCKTSLFAIDILLVQCALVDCPSKSALPRLERSGSCQIRNPSEILEDFHFLSRHPELHIKFV